MGRKTTCADLEEGSGGPDPPPLEFAKLNIADITGNEKIVIFHICALPQLYVKVGPPLEKFSGSAPGQQFNQTFGGCE